MKLTISLLLIALCMAVGVLAAPSRLTFKVGQLLEYKVHGDIDAKGHIVTDGSSTKKSASTLDATLLIKCTEISKDNNYVFVMNVSILKMKLKRNNIKEIKFKIKKGSMQNNNSNNLNLIFLQNIVI